MIAPPPLLDEARRLTTLRGLNILDTAPEERFDRLTRLAKRLFDVPIALISLIDHDRQWFKSAAGLPALQTARELSFCGHVIVSDAVLLVPDALRDARFHDNPFVTGDPHVRFYAGCPLSMPDGSRIGTLCVLDSKPRAFDKQDSVLLSDLARMAEQEFTTVQPVSLDALTRLPNRLAFKAMAQQALDQCCTRQLPASMLVIGLDGFKAINDDYGHGEGDRALVAFTSLLRDTFHDFDVVARIGGDEFALLLWNCAEKSAVLAVEWLQTRLDSHNHAAARGYDIRFSAGQVRVDTSQHCVVETLLAEADHLMYKHKRSKFVGSEIKEKRSGEAGLGDNAIGEGIPGMRLPVARGSTS